MKILLNLMFLLLFASFTTMAQQTPKSIQGLVIDENNEPLIGASVTVPGTSAGTATDLDGKFQLNLPEGKTTVQAAYLGYETKTVNVANQTQVTIQLTPQNQDIDEVVVIGYGTAKKRDLTGAVASIKSEDITIAPTGNVMEALQGRVAGMDIMKTSGQVGSDVNILLRGSRSIYGSNAPLVVVDGIISDYAQINPADVESIDILKDGSSTAIYGAAGSNGVILITTKKGKANKATVNFDAYYGFSGKPEFFHGMTGDGWTNYQREAYKYSNGQYPADMSSILTNPGKLAYYNQGNWIDWVEEASGNTATNQKYNLSVTGGTDKTKVFLSLSYDAQTGLLKTESLKKYGMRLNVDQEIFSWAKVGATTTIGHTNTNAGVRNTFTKALSSFPLGEAYDSTGDIIYEFAPNEYTPLGDLIKNQYVNNRKRIFARSNAYLELTPLKGLSYKSILGGSLSNARLGQYWGKEANALRPTYAGTPHAEVTNDYGYSYTWDNILSYNQTFNKDHSVGATLVSSWTYSQSENNKAAGSGQNLDSWTFYRLVAATAPHVESDYSQSQAMGYAVRLNYSYQGKYLLTFSNRWDGVSQFSVGHKWGVFPAGAVAWRISDEAFMKNTQDWLNNLKLRAGYGVMGNPGGLNPYSTQTKAYAYSNAGISIDGKIVPFTQYTETYGNPGLGWEISHNLNVGLDFSLLHNRIDGSIEWFNTQTDGLLFKRTMPITSGITGWGAPLASWENIAETSNRGIEVSINTRNIQTKDFKWNTNLTFTYEKEKIVSLPSGDLIAESLFEGYPIKSMYSYKYAGIWGTDAPAETLAAYGVKPGWVKIETVPQDKTDGSSDNGVHKYSDKDRQILGHNNPDFIVGLNNSFTYKNFDFSLFIMARYGQTIQSGLLGWYNAKTGDSNNQIAGVDYWTETNQGAYYPVPGSGNEQSAFMPALVYRDGSFIKLKNATLGYQIPQAISRKAKMEKLRIYATAYNPFVYTKDKQLRGTDPENNGGDSFPLYKQFVFGVNITF
ncbi:SusC/RagA family TonB-linked outer membrane protein [Bacteroidia bacterium]|nr:SusC/RagA family TonB-linked outer membrane protein [Bacteroidia bacterium]